MNLQEAFEKFKKTKKQPKTKNINLNRTKEFKDNLRIKFVDQCKKYIGVPYSGKDYSKDDPIYNFPLFLDCCGLVRKAVRDWKKDFGFKIGPGNQVYQYDTLPNIIEEKDAKLGDLVFIKSKYIGKRNLKKQIHDLTHIEVYIGEGKTIGARFRKNFVKIWDSYKFPSKNYIDKHYIIKSIDTWLDGICKSFCNEHDWKLRTNIKRDKISKYSLFYEEDIDNNAQEYIKINKLMSKNKILFYNNFFNKNKIPITLNNYDENLIKEDYYIINESLIFNDINWNLTWYNLYNKLSKKINSIDLTYDIKEENELYIAKNLDDGSVKRLTTKKLKGDFIYQKYFKNFKLHNEYKVNKKIFLFINYGNLIGKKIIFLHSKNRKKIEDNIFINEFCKKYYISGSNYDNLIIKKKENDIIKNKEIIEVILKELDKVLKNIPIIILCLDFFEIDEKNDLLFDLDLSFSHYGKKLIKTFGNFFKLNYNKIN